MGNPEQIPTFIHIEPGNDKTAYVDMWITFYHTGPISYPHMHICPPPRLKVEGLPKWALC